MLGVREQRQRDSHDQAGEPATTVSQRGLGRMVAGYLAW